MYEIRLEPVEGKVKRPSEKGHLPAWARKALSNRHFRGMTGEGRLAVMQSGPHGTQGGWMQRGGAMVPFPFDHRNLPLHTHATQERMLVAVGPHNAGTLWEVELESGQARLVCDEPGTHGVYVGEERVLSSSRERTALWDVEGEVSELGSVRGGRTPLAGPFEVDGHTVVLAEDRVSITHRANVYVVGDAAPFDAGRIVSNEPHGFGGYGPTPLPREGGLLIKSQKKRPGGTAWYALRIVS